MKRRFIAFTGYAFFWIIFFFAARLFFILTHSEEAFQYNFGRLVATFFHGVKLDISTTGYFLLLPVLAAIPGLWLNGQWLKVFIRWYTYLLIFFCAIVIVGDSVLYKYWGFRMDHTPLAYLQTPKEAIASGTTWELILVPLAILSIAMLTIFFYNNSVDKLFHGFKKVRYPVAATCFFIVFLSSLIIPIRGGTGIAPINAGTVYFDESMFINHTAINVVWNFGSSAVNQKPTKNPYNYTDSELADNLTTGLLIDNGQSADYLKTKNPNILFIVLESFGSAIIGPLGGDSLTTPCFNSYIEKGVLFTNFYASGNRTDKAMHAILNGYPAQPVASIMKEPKKTQSLPGIIRSLSESGYSSSFWYGGEINFANFNSFVINSGFKNIITMNNFDPVNYNSKWGVHDNILFDALKDSMQTMKEPFVRVVLTLSSHEPFEVPMDPVFQGRDDLTKFRNSIYYADKSLGDFLNWASDREWWKNTLVILVADHYRRNSSDVPAYSEEIFRIPMLWLGGALVKEGIKIDKYGSQTDIPVTVLNQMGMNVHFPFGKDLLSEGSNSFAFYTFNEGFGFITDSSKFIFDHKLGKPVVEEGRDPGTAGEMGKAYLQVLFEDYLKR